MRSPTYSTSARAPFSKRIRNLGRPRLRLAKDQLVRSQVVVWYALVDEFLNSRIAHYFFSRRRSFPELWRTKRFKLFNYHVLEELSLLQKLRFVKAIEQVPKPIVAYIGLLNA